jgi:nucleoporin SEH1
LDPNLNDWSLSNSVYIPSLVPAGSTDASADATQVSPTTTDELATGGWGLSWCKERWWGSVLAVFAGTSAVVKVSYLPNGIFDQADPSDPHAEPISHILNPPNTTILLPPNIRLMGTILW